jgi:hypothetical protein
MSENPDHAISVLTNSTFSPSLDELWIEIYKMMNDSPTARRVEGFAASLRYGRERFATTLALILIAADVDNQKRILELAAMQPPPPILVPKGQIVYLPSENRGPGC